MKPLTREQRVALLSMYHRDWGHNEKPTYLDWRRECHQSFCGAFMVPWCGMWLGIEPDGYAHSQRGNLMYDSRLPKCDQCGDAAHVKDSGLLLCAPCYMKDAKRSARTKSEYVASIVIETRKG